MIHVNPWGRFPWIFLISSGRVPVRFFSMNFEVACDFRCHAVKVLLFNLLKTRVVLPELLTLLLKQFFPFTVIAQAFLVR